MAFILSISPILILIVLMVAFKVRGDWSAVAALLATVVLALWAVPHMEGISAGAAAEHLGPRYVWWAFVEGVLKAVFPILIIILMAIYSYNVLLESKQIELIKQQFSNFSSNKRLQVLLIVWGFGGLLEGMAGFGTAVAIPAAILIGLGFKPAFSALVSLIGNSVATGFGAVGVPVITLAKEAHGSEVTSSVIRIVAGDVVIQLSVLMFLIPFVILYLSDRSRKYILPNIILSLLIGAISLVSQFVAAYYIGAESPAIIGSIACILFLLIYARISERKQPRESSSEQPHYTTKQYLRAWSVYGLILIFILLASPLSGTINQWLTTTGVSRIALPLYESGKTFNFGWLSNAGLMLFLGAFIGGLIQGVSLGRLWGLLGKTLIKLYKSTITIISLVAMSAIMSHAGMISCIANALVEATGSLYPLFAPLVGAIGTFATGSDTSSNILFGKLQAEVSGSLNMNTSWLAAANTAGATGGKIISPQSIAIATASCDQQGQEGAILRSALPYALGYVIIAGITVYCCTFLAL